MPGRRHRIAMFLAAVAIAAWLAATGSAEASSRACSFRNPVRGGGPYIAHVTTNLTRSALGGNAVCATVAGAVARLLAHGYALGRCRHLVDGGESWSVAHRLVTPPGWPQPTGPAYDPHMRVVLHLLAPGGSRRYWIKLDEFT